MRQRALVGLLVSTVVALTTTSSIAGLLGVKVAQPLITFQNTSGLALTYTASNQFFAVDASPTAVQFSGAETPLLVTGTRDLSIRATVNHVGNLVRGVPGGGLTLSGTVRRIVNDVTNTYSGVLLTGEVTGFGFLECGTTDRYDFRFTATGGALSNFFSSGDIGVQVTSEASTFAGSFTTDFNGRVRGNVGLEGFVPCPLSVVGWGDNGYGQLTPPAGLSNIVAIAAGGRHSLALKSDGTVVAWGENWYGQADVPWGLANVVAIAAGGDHSLALKGDGTVVAWGSNIAGESTVPAGLTNLVAIACGYLHSLALEGDGTVIVWGENGNGQANVPPGLTNAVAIAGGAYHSVALKRDGTVVAWGFDNEGETDVPANATNVVAISTTSAGGHNLALKDDGTVVAWGPGPSVPPDLANVVGIAAGGGHNVALKGDGTVVAWGDNSNGQTNVPPGLTNVVAIAAGGSHSLALTGGPSAPSALSATAVAGNEVDLSWTDNSLNEDGFKIERAVGAGGSTGTWAQIAMVGTNITNYSDTEVVTNTTYWYRVRAYNGCGESLYSGPIGVTMVSVPPTLSISGPGSTICDTIPADSDAGVSFGNVVAGQTYGYQASGCVGINGDGNAFDDPDGKEHWDSNCTVFKTEWTGGDGFVCPGMVAHSLVAKIDGANCVQLGSTGSFVAPVSGALVLYVNDDWFSDNSGLWNVCVTANSAFSGMVGGPFAPSSQVYLLTNSGNIPLNWSASASETWLSFSATGGTLGAGASAAVTISINSNADGLAVGTYSNAVAFVNLTNGNGSTTQMVTLSVNVIPAPSGLTATAVAAGEIDLSWTDNSSGQTGFLIERAPNDGGNPGTWAQIASVDAGVTFYSDTAVVTNTTYWYRVRAYNAIGDSLDSGPASVTVAPPIAPSTLTATAVALNRIKLSWTDNSSDETGFKVERSLDGTNFTQIAQVSANATNYLDTGLSPNTTYYYRVCAYNFLGGSAFSNVASAATPVVCPLSVVGWGYNGDGETTPPAGLSNVVAVAAGVFHSLALESDGTVVGWGYDGDGEATPPAGLSNVVAIAGGYLFSLALKSDGKVVGWGSNSYGQTNVRPGIRNVVAIAAGGYHSLALESDGTVVGWGANWYGQATPPAGLTGVVAITVGFYHSLALKSDGTVVGWGLNDSGQATPPAGLTGVVAVAAGYEHSLALKSDGTVVGWGNNEYGQVMPPDGLTGVVAIAAGYEHSLALESDGTVVGWGADWYGQATPPDGLTGVAAIAAGYIHSLALTVVPSTPSALTGTVAAGNEVDLSWTDNSSTEDGFKIERAPDAGGSPGTWEQIGTVGTNVTAYSDSAVVANSTYWYRVRAYNRCGDSLFSDPASVIVAPPVAPSNLTATAVAVNQVDLWWTDNSNNESGFKIERAQDVDGSPGTWALIATVGAGVTFYSDTGATTCTTYWYRLRAYNAIGESANSDAASATIAPPAAPSNLAAYRVAMNQVDLSWTDNSLNEDGFKIERAPDAVGSPGTWVPIASVGADVTSYSDTAATACTTYWYRVTAYNTCGDSANSGLASATIGPPAAPSGLTATAIAANEVDLSWTDNSNNEDGFKIERALDDKGNPGSWTQIASVGAGVTSYSDPGVTTNTTYWYRVRAYNTCGDSPDSGQVSVIVAPPVAPSNLTATVVAMNQIKFSWTDNSTNEDGFTVERSLDGTHFTQIAQLPANTTTYLNTGLFPNTTYYYRVRAYKSPGGAAPSNVASVSTPALSCPSVVGWGDNDYGQTTPPAGLTGAVAMAGGFDHSLALKSDGTVVGWGDNEYGAATPPAGLTGVVAIAAGAYHSFALKSDGTVVGWGADWYGEATPPAGLNGVVAIAGGYYHSLALKSDGTVVGWGYNYDWNGNWVGQATPPVGLSNVVAIAAGTLHSLALKSDGTVVGWGDNEYGAATPPAGLTGVVAIAAGWIHSVALKSDGTVVDWGTNWYGVRTPPAGLSGVVAIAAGGWHGLALKSDGSVVAWGANFDWNGNWEGQATLPTGLAGVAAIAAGWWHSLAVATRPSPPSGLTATAVAANEIDLSWSENSTGVDGFEIERAPDAGSIPGTWTQIAAVGADVTFYSDTGVVTNTPHWYRVRAYTACTESPYSVLRVPAIPTTVILDDTWSTGVRTNQNLPTSSAWWCSSSSAGALTAATNSMTLTVGESSIMPITYFTPDSSSPPVQLNVGDTLTTTLTFMFNGVPTAASSSQGFRIGLFNFAGGNNTPKRVSNDDSFTSGSQGSGVQGYALFGKMYTTFSDNGPIDIKKRVTLSDSQLLGTTADWTTLAKDSVDTSAFPGFANGTPYRLQFVLQRTSLNSMVITVSWLNLNDGTSISDTATDNSASNFGFDGIALRPQNYNQAPVSNQFQEVRIELTSAPIAPLIVTQPQDQSVPWGQDVLFTVVPNGTLPLFYQWYYNGDSPIPNATNATLTLPDIQPSEAGGYSVLVSNSYGSVASVVAQLTVLQMPPVITLQPQDLTVVPGQSATFNVAAVGNRPLCYQWWYYNTSTLLTGATANTLTLTNVQPGDAGSYSVVVSNFLGSVISSNALLTVSTNPVAPVFITQPASLTVVDGASVNFTAAAVGTQPISYQWKKNGSPLANATNTTYAIASARPSDAGTYSVTASNPVGSTTSSATLTVLKLAFSGAEGFGGTSSGGRSGAVYHVTNLNDSGSGSFRDAVSQPNRTIVFDVSGTIDLASNLSITKPNLTIAGQTAPGDGITLKGWMTEVRNTHDVIVRYIRCRPGDVNCTNFQEDAFHFLDATNCIADHVSASWSIDETLSTTWSTNVTVQWCMISEPLTDSCHLKGAHGYGSLIRYGAGGVTYHHNLYAHCSSRNPRGPSDSIRLDFVNNVIYNWGFFAGYNEDDAADNPYGYMNFANYVNNYLIAGANTTQDPPLVFRSGVLDAAFTQIYQSGNLMDANRNGVLDGDDLGWSAFSGPFTRNTTRLPFPLVDTDSANAAYVRVLSAVGASLARDAVDSRIVSNVLQQNGLIIDSQNEVGGWPTLNSLPAPTDTDQDGMPDFWEVAVGLNPNDPADRNGLTPDGYTQLEAYLNWLGGPHARVQTNSFVNVELPRYIVGMDSPTYGVSNLSHGVVTLLGDGHTAQFTPAPGFSGLASFLFTATEGSVSVTGTVSVLATPANLVWRGDGTANNWDVTTTANWRDGTNVVTFSPGDNVTFNDTGSNSPAINLVGPLLPSSVTVTAAQNYTFSGTGSLGGVMTLVKSGPGQLTVTTSNTFSGGTTVGSGTLLVNNTAGSGTGVGAVTVLSNGTLGGSGVIGGPVTVNGTLALSGNGAGILTISNSLVVNSGAAFALGTNNYTTVVSGDLTLNGPLNISDAGGFTVGVYTLFAYSGALTCNAVTIDKTPNPSYAYTIDTNTAGQVKLNVVAPASTILGEAGALEDRFGNLAPANSVAVLVADTGNNGFVDPQPSFPLVLGATWGTDDKVIGLWRLTECSDCGDGYLYGSTEVAYTGGIVPGQRLQLYWFPSLTLASNVVGVTYYGKYSDTNNPPVDGDPWEMPVAGSDVHLTFFTEYLGGSNPDTAGQATYLTADPLSASFTASPTNGAAPLAGTPLAAWQMQYFGNTTNPAAAPDADPDGDGMSNLQEFLAGTDPTNSASAFRITGIAIEGEDVRVTWTMGSDRTNALQVFAGDPNAALASTFTDLFIVTNTVGSVTNYLDPGAVTNAPARYYRVRLVP